MDKKVHINFWYVISAILVLALPDRGFHRGHADVHSLPATQTPSPLAGPNSPAS